MSPPPPALCPACARPLECACRRFFNCQSLWTAIDDIDRSKYGRHANPWSTPLSNGMMSFCTNQSLEGQPSWVNPAWRHTVECATIGGSSDAGSAGRVFGILFGGLALAGLGYLAYSRRDAVADGLAAVRSGRAWRRVRGLRGGEATESLLASSPSSPNSAFDVDVDGSWSQVGSPVSNQYDLSL